MQGIKQFVIYFMDKLFVLIITLTALQNASAACDILTSSGKYAKNIEDGIALILSSSKDCPKNVFEFRKKIKEANLTIETTMVANRGYHNPSQGSFSFFETVTGTLDSFFIQRGDFFFGHFTTVDENNELTADQGFSQEPRLMIEAFAWDTKKHLFNFYELIGDGNNNQWFYRGDSSDIDADNTLLHRQPDPSSPQFGKRLRCSGCHGAGGPIMKEIYSPHNDWWEPIRKLDFGGRVVNSSIFDMIENLVPPQRLAENVLLGMNKLESYKGSSDKNVLSFQEKLRPLFCPVEINFISDRVPNEERNNDINIPIEFFINKNLSDNQIKNIVISRTAYEHALISTGSHFPETSLLDADHAWLAPVKAMSDQLVIEHLIKTGLIDEKFAYDVLSIDMTNPALSDARCALLKYVPNYWSNDWKNNFIERLKSSNNTTALELVRQLNNADHTPEYHKKKGIRFLKNCINQLKNEDNVKKLFLLLAQRRIEVKASEISKNPRGQILEPGFRVLFPEIEVKPVPGKLMLTSTCEIKESTKSK